MIASANVTVVTFGEQFVGGMTGSMSGTIGGRQVTVQWSEAAQNFVITSVGGTGSVPNVAGRWNFQLSYVSENCNFLSVPPDLPTTANSTLTFSQNGSALTAVEVTLVLTGSVQPDGDFLITSTPDVRTAGSCVYGIGAAISGNFLSGTATLSFVADRISGTCIGVSLPCSVNYTGTMTKLSPSLAQSDSGEDRIEAILRTIGSNAE